MQNQNIYFFVEKIFMICPSLLKILKIVIIYNKHTTYCALMLQLVFKA